MNISKFYRTLLFIFLTFLLIEETRATKAKDRPRPTSTHPMKLRQRSSVRQNIQTDMQLMKLGIQGRKAHGFVAVGVAAKKKVKTTKGSLSRTFQTGKATQKSLSELMQGPYSAVKLGQIERAAKEYLEQLDKGLFQGLSEIGFMLMEHASKLLNGIQKSKSPTKIHQRARTQMSLLQLIKKVTDIKMSELQSILSSNGAGEHSTLPQDTTSDQQPGTSKNSEEHQEDMDIPT